MIIRARRPPVGHGNDEQLRIVIDERITRTRRAAESPGTGG
jgi:hypothetical protein